ncbi:MAG: beta-ketoacyl synthase chain length factor, partial [Saprospiraceae bacterium]|nr:beta-ketoacyl synthase chain length factor [Saprospiraceae bacterium]
FLRRMSRLIKMGVCTAKIAMLHEEEGFDPDAILVGTGMGCLEDTEKFLKDIYENEEEISSPTQFMQSTHNTVASQIAIMLGCKNYNFTYVHRGFSFESALFDAMLQFSEGEGKKMNILLGALDEITETYLDVTKKLKFWKPNDAGEGLQLSGAWDHVQAGEGAAFFVLSNEKNSRTHAEMKGVEMIYRPDDTTFISGRIDDFLQRHGLTKADLDVVVLGRNGNPAIDKEFDALQNSYFKDIPQASFKHLCGEYKTASSFAFWLGSQIVKRQEVPEVVKFSPFSVNKIKHLLIYNNYSNLNHSLVLLSHVE